MKAYTNPKKNTDENFYWREDSHGGVHISVKRGALQTVSINTKSSPLDTRSFKVLSNNSSQNEKAVKDCAVAVTKELMSSLSTPPDDQFAVEVERLHNSSEISAIVDVSGDLVKAEAQTVNTILSKLDALFKEIKELRTRDEHRSGEIKELQDEIKELRTRDEHRSGEIKELHERNDGLASIVVPIQLRKMIYIARELAEEQPSLFTRPQHSCIFSKRVVDPRREKAHEFVNEEEIKEFHQYLLQVNFF